MIVLIAMPELQDVFQQFDETYCSNHMLPTHILKTMSDIESCRTSDLGSQTDRQRYRDLSLFN